MIKILTKSKIFFAQNSIKFLLDDKEYWIVKTQDSFLLLKAMHARLALSNMIQKSP
jgi:hypothetical protein